MDLKPISRTSATMTASAMRPVMVPYLMDGPPPRPPPDRGSSQESRLQMAQYSRSGAVFRIDSTSRRTPVYYDSYMKTWIFKSVPYRRAVVPARTASPDRRG